MDIKIMIKYTERRDSFIFYFCYVIGINFKRKRRNRRRRIDEEEEEENTDDELINLLWKMCPSIDGKNPINFSSVG